LFATHYFELTTLAEEIATVQNVHLDATEHADKIIFLHTVQPGPANQSYGIQVAQLAGVPRSVIQRAKQKLQELEQQAYQQTAEYSPVPEQRDLFAAVEKEHPVITQLHDINPDQLTPKEALELLYQLKAEVK
jgi:DNA mismatch repair protein MutS